MYYLGLQEALDDWYLFFSSCGNELDMHPSRRMYQRQSHKSLDGDDDGGKDENENEDDDDDDDDDENGDCEVKASLERLLSIP